MPLLQPHTESVEMSFALRDTYLESALVCNVMMHSTLYKIWLPHDGGSANGSLLCNCNVGNVEVSKCISQIDFEGGIHDYCCNSAMKVFFIRKSCEADQSINRLNDM